MSSAIQSIRRNNGGGATGCCGVSGLAGGVLDLVVGVGAAVFADAAPEDDDFLSFGTFDLSILDFGKTD